MAKIFNYAGIGVALYVAFGPIGAFGKVSGMMVDGVTGAVGKVGNVLSATV
ncbi:MAG: hypothetical protein K9G62_07320 [Alphaproteobacteria bacterium]|nr:hypothetical protein [Alphaproteobacteria bacterium]